MKRPLAVTLGITGDLGFAAGCFLRAFARHSPGCGAEVLVYTDGALPGEDAALLHRLGARVLPYTPPDAALPEEAVKQFSRMCLAKLEAFRLLEMYTSVIWLDVDTAIQGDIREMASYGPFSLALEDPHFTEKRVTSPASINVSRAVPGLAMEEPNYNTGVMVLRDDLPDPEGLYSTCMEWLSAHGTACTYPDQAVLNMLAQKLRREAPALFKPLPHDAFNAHPRNPAAWRAIIVHAFGAYKIWNDGLTRCCFPEWERDYDRWVAGGGTPWRGEVENAAFLEGGAFHMLSRVYETTIAAQGALDALQAELETERAVRARFEKLAARLAEG